MPKNLSQKSSFQLFLWGLLLVPFAIVADAVLTAILFGEGSLQQQLFSPSYHELAIRVLFSIFILAAIYLGMHFLANTAQKEGSLQQSNKDLNLIRQDIEEFQDQLLRQWRNTSSELATSVELLRDHCVHNADEKTRFFVDSVCNASNKLNDQLDISLALAEQTLGEPQRKHVKLDMLALDLAEELKSKHPDRQLEFKVQPWINGWCDQKLLRFVIGTLFRSAMDFIPSTSKGLIEFGMFHRNSQKVFFVRNNGTGFSDAQAKHLFDPFRSYTQNSKLPKETVRLANARRTILRHGGQIWAEGIEDVGGTIFFTLHTP